MGDELISLAEKAFFEGNASAAEKMYREAVEFEPTNARAHCGLGRALTKLQRLDEALAEYRAALDIDSALGAAYVGLGTIHGIRKQYAESAIELSRAIQIEPRNGRAHLNLGTTYRLQGRFNEAIEEGVIAFKLAPSFSALISIMRATLGRYPEAASVVLVVIVLVAFQGTSGIEVLIMIAWFVSMVWLCVDAFRRHDTTNGVKYMILTLISAAAYAIKKVFARS
jgi:tetratricopeptide (TPR) repeat protein